MDDVLGISPTRHEPPIISSKEHRRMSHRLRTGFLRASAPKKRYDQPGLRVQCDCGVTEGRKTRLYRRTDADTSGAPASLFRFVCSKSLCWIKRLFRQAVFTSCIKAKKHLFGILDYFCC